MIAAFVRGAAAERPRLRRSLLLGTLSLATFLVVFDDSAVAVALPSLQRDLRLDIGQLEWTLNVLGIEVPEYM